MITSPLATPRDNPPAPICTVPHGGGGMPATSCGPRGVLAPYDQDSSQVAIAINGNSRKEENEMAGLPMALTTGLIDQLADLQRIVRVRLSADGELCEHDVVVLERLMEVKHTAMEADEARLNAVSMLKTGRLGPARLRRQRELAQLQAWERDQFEMACLTEHAAH